MRKKIALKLYTLIQCINDYNMGNEKVQLFFFLINIRIYILPVSREGLQAAEG